ncbi:hypothetical protein P8C59_002863 [Phyllachora maydis]|uniref:Uncharacterized protein n=1 Tax=Phyllachora maydis TaxID=1825666 RepID=A0AAD9M9P9_9PEZI|nr:hypothetical protein P8C59_002863 [Phyllachora maydis]
MCLIFTCGEHTFRKQVEGYENVVCRCYNCGNYSGHVIKNHPWFTFCFVPVLPLSLHGHPDIVCHICNFAQPLEHRPDSLSGVVLVQALTQCKIPRVFPDGVLWKAFSA